MSVSQHREFGLCVLLTLIWGGSFPVIDRGLEFLPPLVFAAARFYVAAAVLLVVVAVGTDQWRPRTKADFYTVTAIGIFIIASNALVFVGQQFTTSGTAAIVVSLSPIMSTAFAWTVLSGTGLSPIGVVGVILGFVGAVIIADPNPSALLSSNTYGVLVIFVSVTGTAFGSVLVERLKPRSSEQTITAWAMLFGALIVHIASIGFGHGVFGRVWTIPALLSTLYLGIFASAIAFTSYIALIHQVGAVQINLITYATPVVAAFVGWAWLGEPITLSMIVGFGFVLAGFILIKRRQLARELSAWSY